MKLSCSFCNFIEVSMKIIFVRSEMLGLKCAKKPYKEHRKQFHHKNESPFQKKGILKTE